MKEYKTNPIPITSINYQLLNINYSAKRTQFFDSRSLLLHHPVHSRAKNADIRPPKRSQFLHFSIENRLSSTANVQNKPNLAGGWSLEAICKTNPFNLCNRRNLRLLFSYNPCLSSQKTTFAKRTQFPDPPNL
jgi:hypothetical protein